MKLFKYKYNPANHGVSRRALFFCKTASGIAFFFLATKLIEETQD